MNKVLRVLLLILATLGHGSTAENWRQDLCAYVSSEEGSVMLYKSSSRKFLVHANDVICGRLT